MKSLEKAVAMNTRDDASRRGDECVAPTGRITMIHNLKPYSACKDSGVAWLGEVPKHWEVRKLGQFGKFIKGNGGNKEDELPEGVPCIRYGDLYTTHSFFIQRSRSYISRAKVEEYTPIRFGDLLFAASGEMIEEIGKSAVNLIKTEARCGGDVILFRASRQVEARYLGYAADCWSAAAQKASLGKGITVMHIYGGQLKNLVLTLPPLSEQAAIVCFLDYTERRIRRYIRAKQKLISLLEEQKRAITHQAVTGQVDVRTGQPYPAYKDSGVEWLGEAPEHWEVRKLGQIGTFLKGNGGNKEDELPDGVPCVRYGDLYTTHCFFIQRSRSCISPAKVKEYTPIRFGDLIFAASGETIEEIGKSAVNLIETEACCGGDVILFRASRRVEARYLGYAADSWSATAQKASMGKGITVMHIYGGQLKYLVLTLPPLHEQTDIVRFLNQTTVKIDEGISRARREIKLLGEYRSRLVADVVTGKLDVREAATRLPQEADEFASIDDSDDLAGSEEPHGDIELAVSEAPA